MLVIMLYRNHMATYKLDIQGVEYEYKSRFKYIYIIESHHRLVFKQY